MHPSHVSLVSLASVGLRHCDPKIIIRIRAFVFLDTPVLTDYLTLEGNSRRKWVPLMYRMSWRKEGDEKTITNGCRLRIDLRSSIPSSDYFGRDQLKNPYLVSLSHLVYPL